ncbi:hypothetical protein B0H10DRAFT_1954153 [Mycena sp. CBHHK59/15]|nr:hypothetical protein B0H10DRAFT_1954153 [Mycena sp. CBHHK59/15]
MPFSSPFHRDHLFRTKQYSAGPLFPSSFVFRKSGRGHTLTEIMPGPIDPEGPAPPDAILIAIGTVSESRMFVSPIGNWSISSGEKYTRSIGTAKYTFMINKPTNDPTFAPDFPVALAALKKAQTSISKTGKNLWFIVEDGSEEAIRFSFNIFEEKDPNTGNDITTWPVPLECRELMESIYKSHSIREFVVFDTDNTRVDPINIPSKLKGALVECSFKLVHYSFGNDDSFSGIIQQVVILRPPPLKPPSPYKKSSTKPYRPPAMSPAEVHVQEQLAVKHFTPPILLAGPLNLPLPKDEASTQNLKRKSSSEPEGSAVKRINSGES